MKIALITDTHFNFKKANKVFHDYFLKFYENVFFSELKKRKIKTVIHLGDAFDNRKGIDYWALEWAKKNVYDKFSNLGIDVYSIVGNHDSYYKNTNEVNAIDCLLDQYENVIKVSSPKEFIIGNIKCGFIPWICSDNQEKVYEFLKNTESKVLFGHLELNGFQVYPGHFHTGGMDKEIFNKFDRVFSGHYHTKSDDGKIFYLGNPYQMFWSDVNDKRGFHIFDTDNCEIEYIENPYTMFEKIYYDDTEINDFDLSYLSGKIVKVIIRKKDNETRFENFMDRIYKENPVEVKVVEIIDLKDGDVDCSGISTEDTMTILNKYVEESQFNLNKDIIKEILREIYKEALEIQ